MNEFAVNWSGRGHKYTDEEIGLVVDLMRNADPLTQGRYQAEFEKRFANFTGANSAFAVSSCTAALELAALLCRLNRSDEVILPAHTFAATAIPFARTGAKLVWADIDPGTRVVSADTICPLITDQTRVIIVVHLYGLVCDMAPIMKLARENNILVVEDAAQAIGARYNGQMAGSIGDFGCYSFHSHKNMTTLGEGGVLTVQDPVLAKHVPGLRHNGMRGFSGDRTHYWKPAMSNVDFDYDGLWPYNFCASEIQCALGTKLLDRVESMNADRRVRAVEFIGAFKDYPELVFQDTPAGCGHAWHLMVARYDGQAYGAHRDDLIEMLAIELGVKTAVQYYPLYRYPMFEKAGFGAANCPETDRLFDNMISFPFHHWMLKEDFECLIDQTRRALDRLRQRP